MREDVEVPTLLSRSKFIVWYKSGIRIPKVAGEKYPLSDYDSIPIGFMDTIPQDLCDREDLEIIFEEAWINDLIRKTLFFRLENREIPICYEKMLGGSPTLSRIATGNHGVTKSLPTNRELGPEPCLCPHSAGIILKAFYNRDNDHAIRELTETPWSVASLELILEHVRSKLGRNTRPDKRDQSLCDDIQDIIEFKRQVILDHKFMGLWD